MPKQKINENTINNFSIMSKENNIWLNWSQAQDYLYTFVLLWQIHTSFVERN